MLGPFHRFGMDAFLLRDIIYATTSMINTEYEYKQVHRKQYMDYNCKIVEFLAKYFL